MRVVTRSAEETIELGRRVGRLLGAGQVLALMGPLGSGKTTLTKGLAEGLGVEDGRWVTSPTFVLVHEYEGRVPVYHIDAYRLSGAGDAEALGVEEMFFGGGVTVVEWPERIAEALPDERLEVHLAHGDGDERRLEFEARGERYEKVVAALEGQGA